MSAVRFLARLVAVEVIDLEEKVTLMQRRDFFKSTLAGALAGELVAGKAEGKVSAHLWGKYDFGAGPQVTDRLNQGPFPQYPPHAVLPPDHEVMTTTRTDEVVPNNGKGLDP